MLQKFSLVFSDEIFFQLYSAVVHACFSMCNRLTMPNIISQALPDHVMKLLYVCAVNDCEAILRLVANVGVQIYKFWWERSQGARFLQGMLSY